jgi:hypothetical protein
MRLSCSTDKLFDFKQQSDINVRAKRGLFVTGHQYGR